MEPLIATDWLKDYDPLFDLFDEEMRAGGQVASSADYFNEYDLNNIYSPYKQNDELSLILGIEWMPCLDLASPTASAGSSAAPSPATSSAPSPASGSQCSTSSCSLPASAPTTKLATIQTTSSASATSRSARGSAGNSSGGGSNISKRRRKGLRMKGTSLLAQPSPKQQFSSTSSPVSYSSTKQQQPLSTLLTINKQSTASPLVVSQQVLPLVSKQATIKTTATNSTTDRRHLKSLTFHANLSTLDRTMRYCVKIEHAYSLS